MSEFLLWIVVIVTAITGIAVFAVAFLMPRSSESSSKDVREELRLGREESRLAAKDLREELSGALRAANETLATTLGRMMQGQQAQLQEMSQQLREFSASGLAANERIRETFDVRVKDLQQGNEQKLDAMRKDAAEAIRATNQTLSQSLDRFGTVQQERLDGMTGQIRELSGANQSAMEKVREILDTRVKELQVGNERKFDEIGKHVNEGLKLANDALAKTLERMGGVQYERLEGMTRQLKELGESNHGAIERIRTTLDARVKELQDGNERKLDEMRKTVDEKLHDTLEKRLGESFKLVGEQLEAVQRGLGEMTSLATGVGDLKRVLTNVKVRGTWAEYQLEAILEQVLAPDQYSKNVRVKPDSQGQVEFAVRLPGPKNDPARCVWLPIDSKFPQEDYLRLQEAAESMDRSAVQKATDDLVRAVRAAAKDIHEKYVSPPDTTDFGVMFFATEGLYAEVIRQPSLVHDLQHQYRVIVAGPTTLTAILNSLRVGFQTLAIEQRAAEVWNVLRAVKTEFGKFGGVLDKVKRQLQTASKSIEDTGTRTRVMERRLHSVERLPDAEAQALLALPKMLDDSDAEELEPGEPEVSA